MRNTLKKYLGKRVIIDCMVEGRPINHEKTGREFDKNTFSVPDYRKNTRLVGYEPYLDARSPIEFYEYATCIKDVRGVNAFKDIMEDHINLQEDIMTLWTLKKGDKIRLSAVVAEYTKYGGKDYCLVNIERIIDRD